MTAETGADKDAREDDNLSRVNASNEKGELGQAVPFENPQMLVFAHVACSWNMYSVDCQYDVTNMQIRIKRRTLADDN